MKDWQKQLREEFAELYARYCNLDAFLKHGSHHDVDKAELGRLRCQRGVMEEYLDILKERLEAAGLWEGGEAGNGKVFTRALSGSLVDSGCTLLGQKLYFESTGSKSTNDHCIMRLNHKIHEWKLQ